MDNSQLEALGLRHLASGKVRDLCAWRDEIWLVASDRISAYDCILEPELPGKGQVLTELSRFWFEQTARLTENHVVSFDLPPEVDLPAWAGRVTRARRLEIIPMECVVRGYLSGSGWREYRDECTVGGIAQPAGLRESDRLPETLFTPATKATEGHDVNLTPTEAEELVGRDLYVLLKALSISLYEYARDYAAERGILIADTKFEFGTDAEGNVILADEILTPDSSRFWPADAYEPGRGQPSFDKQFVRDYLDSLDWDKTPPAPRLPDDIVAKTMEKYREALTRLKG
ncbi:MAG: phosphoribosylaminoimidazolesuccinocarboxamide synthase [Verrucomicrobiota bacterium]